MDNSTVWKIINKMFEDNPQSLVRHHIDSYNEFFKTGIFQIFKEKNPIRISTRFDKTINEYRSQCVMYFGGKNGDKIYFGKPIIYDDDNAHYMCPNEARLRNMTYGMTIHYDIEVEFIDILETGERPAIVGLEMNGGNADDDNDDINPDFKMHGGAKTGKLEEEQKEFGQGTGQGQGQGQGKRIGQAKALPIRKKQQARREVELTTAETALFKEATEKSMINPNTQKRTITLEKILLGKFPIMLQSNYCVLTGLPREVRHTMGECLNDVGGYFIIDGKEKTVISQEQFGNNMLYIRESGDENFLYSAEIRSVSENASKPIRTLSVKIVAPTNKYTFKNIVVNIPNVKAPIPLFIVFRALGIISDKQIITMCLLDLDKYESMIDHFAPSVHNAGGIMNQRNALKFIATFTKGKTVSHALEILADYFLPHIGEINFIQKAYYLGYITFRLLSVYTGLELPTDRDNFKFKRIQLVGSLIYDLFREYYTIQQRQIQLSFEEKVHYNQNIYADNLLGLINKNYKEVLRERTLENGFKKAFKGNWGAQTHTKLIGVVQDLNRLSHNSMMSHLRKTNLPLDASVKVVGPRVLHNTQWGLFDPIDTPDGANIGIHKHLAISACVTQGYSREHIIKWLREKIADMKLLEECTPHILSTMTKVIVNGYWIGALNTPIETVQKMKLFRRNGLIPIYTSITFNIKQNTIFIYTDSGRICRPIFYRDPESNKMSFENKSIQEHLKEDDFSWNNLITGFNRKKIKEFDPNNNNLYELHELYEGVSSESNPAKLQRFWDDKAIIDFLDASETEDAYIAMNNEDLEKDSRLHTHMEIHESFIFGMLGNLIIFPENNPAVRNSFSCGQSKQACSMYHTNYQVRMDKTAVVLNSGQVPLVKTRYMEHINNESNPYGENAIVAIMTYTGYNVEDAVLINAGSLKRGLFRTTYYSTYETHEEKTKTADATVEQLFTNIEHDTMVTGTKPGYDYSKLDKYGLIRENTPIDDKTVLIGLTVSSSANKNAKQDMSKTPKKGQLGIVDKSFITDSEEGKRIAKIRIREERIPNIGDKMASRAGQKGTIGLVVPEEDMPFNKDGIRPDIIVNPHALPTRMTIGQLVECIIGKASAIYGGYSDCTAFNNKGSKSGVFGDMLSREGYHSSGNEVLYNGMTGEQIEAEIFMGPNYYMRLKHMVKDKINYRALGPRTALTRQPVSGRANDGGLRIGEMERDSVISHGMADFLRESMMERGDKYYMAVCNTTGMLAVYNPSKNLFMSPMADGPIKYVGSLDGKEMNIENITKFGRNYSVVAVPYSLKLLLQELQTTNIQLRIITEDNIKQIENMSYSNNINKLMQITDKSEFLTVTKTVPDQIVFNIKYALKMAEKEPKGLKTPSLEMPESPQLPNVSPAYEPNEAELETLFKNANNSNSPQYIPYDPNVPYTSIPRGPYTAYSPDFSPKSPNFSPKSPDFSPPEDMQNSVTSGLPPSNEQNLSQLASTFNIGENVHYRGDSNNNRLWTITYIGDRFLNIETPGAEPLLVTALDIYRQGDFTYNSPYAENLFEEQNTLQLNQPSSLPNQNPAINFAPVIKITNGSDFSSPTEPVNSGVSDNMNFAPVSTDSAVKGAVKGAVNGAITGTSTVAGVIEPKPTETSSNKIDFQNLVIKKNA